VNIHVLEISSPKKSTRRVSLQSAIFVGSESLKMFLFKVHVVQELLPKTMLLVSFIVSGLLNMWLLMVIVWMTDSRQMKLGFIWMAMLILRIPEHGWLKNPWAPWHYPLHWKSCSQLCEFQKRTIITFFNDMIHSPSYVVVVQKKLWQLPDSIKHGFSGKWLPTLPTTCWIA
jgi:hypothetical protein